MAMPSPGNEPRNRFQRLNWPLYRHASARSHGSYRGLLAALMKACVSKPVMLGLGPPWAARSILCRLGEWGRQLGRSWSVVVVVVVGGVSPGGIHLLAVYFGLTVLSPRSMRLSWGQLTAPNVDSGQYKRSFVGVVASSNLGEHSRLEGQAEPTTMRVAHSVGTVPRRVTKRQPRGMLARPLARPLVVPVRP